MRKENEILSQCAYAHSNRAGTALQIRVARKRAGLSQAELARRMGVTQQQTQRLEDTDRSNPTVATLRAVAAALGVRLRLSFATQPRE